MTNRCPRCSAILVAGFGCVAHGEPPVVLDADVVAELTRERRRARPSRRWTQAEWDYVESKMRVLAGPAIAKELTERFGHKRTWKALKHQMERRGIKKPPVRTAKREPKARPLAESRPRGHWPVVEVAALEDGEVTVLVRVRTKDAIQAKARRMGLTVRSGDGMLSVRQVSSHWRLRHASVLAWIDRGLLPAERSGGLWRIEPTLAERLVPVLARVSRRMCGRAGWWNDPALLAWIDREKRRIRAMERNVDDLVRPALVRQEEDE